MNRERLRAFRSMAREAEQIRYQLADIEARMYSPKVQRLSALPKSAGDGHSMEDAAISHLQLQDRYRTQLNRIEREQLAIEEAIEDLSTEQRMVIRYRYLDLLPWEQVCRAMRYEWAQTHRIHAAALKALEAKDA